MSILMSRLRGSFLTLLLGSLLLQGCAQFTSHYDAIRHQNFTKLKAVHMQFLDHWSQGSKKQWQQQAVEVHCDRGDLSFRQAYEYAKSKDNADKTGQKAVKLLWQEFQANCLLSLKKQKLFSKVFKDSLVEEIERNYDYAIAGELTRVK